MNTLILKYIQVSYQNISLSRFSVCASDNRLLALKLGDWELGDHVTELCCSIIMGEGLLKLLGFSDCFFTGEN